MDKKENKNNDKYTVVEGAIELPKPIPPRDEDKKRDDANNEFRNWVKKK